ncbi:hypothetical protein ACROYT_G011057 [Oculina patagonica]
MTVESGLNAVKQKETEKQSDDTPLVNDNRIRNCRFCGRNHERLSCIWPDMCIFERNLRLNEKKARLRQQEVPFIGHILTPEGLKPDPCKVEAIVQMPDPTDVHSLRRFLGMVNYLAKFLPRLSDETEVPRNSLKRMLNGVGYLPMLMLWAALKK